MFHGSWFLVHVFDATTQRSWPQSASCLQTASSFWSGKKRTSASAAPIPMGFPRRHLKNNQAPCSAAPNQLDYIQSVGISVALCGLSVPIPSKLSRVVTPQLNSVSSQGKKRLTKQPRTSKEKKKKPRLATYSQHALEVQSMRVAPNHPFYLEMFIDFP